MEKTLFDFDYSKPQRKPASKKTKKTAAKKMSVKSAAEAGHILRTSKVFSKRSKAASDLNVWKYGKRKKR